MNTDIRITKVTVQPGAVITKRTTNSGRKGFGIEVIYTLENGQEIPSTTTRERKKDVLPTVERENLSAAAGAMSANFGDDGRFWGTCTRYTIGLHGLVPDVKAGFVEVPVAAAA